MFIIFGIIKENPDVILSQTSDKIILEKDENEAKALQNWAMINFNIYSQIFKVKDGFHYSVCYDSTKESADTFLVDVCPDEEKLKLPPEKEFVFIYRDGIFADKTIPKEKPKEDDDKNDTELAELISIELDK
jgi:hypothetical protein